MTKFELVFAICLAAPINALGSDHYCTYFGGVSQNAKPDDMSTFQLEKDGCQKGDALQIIIYDRMAGVRGREVMYLSEEIAQLCDLDRPVTVVGHVAEGSGESGALHAVCTYDGKRRRLR